VSAAVTAYINTAYPTVNCVPARLRASVISPTKKRRIILALTDDDKQWIADQLQKMLNPASDPNELLKRDTYRNWGELELGLTMLRKRIEALEVLLKADLR
jgi:DNA-binding PadR family transcriptional regulator